MNKMFAHACLSRILLCAAFLLSAARGATAAYQPFLDWKLGLGDMHGVVTFFGPEEMRKRDVEQPDGSIIATWKGHPRYGDDFAVTVRWQRKPDGLWYGTFSYAGYQGAPFVEEIHFPVIKGDYARDSTFVFAGEDCGTIYQGERFFKPGASISRVYSGAMQFSALINKERPSYYFDHRDPAWNVKNFAFAIAKDGSHFSYTGIHYPGQTDKPHASYAIPYENGFTEFTGDWFEAGQIYKKWGIAQAWNTNRKGENPLRKIGMWVWNRGLIKDALPPVERLQKECGDIPVALDWYWWHSNPYDTDYPEFWPPREGVEPFRAAVARMKSLGIYSQVYINGVCWDLDGKTWSEGGEEGVVVNRDGEKKNTMFNKYNHHRLAYMCGEAPKFQDKISALVKKLNGSGLDGQYLDMIGCASYSRCYNPAHCHSKGGGADIVKGFRGLLKRLKQENPSYPLTTEGCTEPYMDLLDGVIVCNSLGRERLGGSLDPVPLFQSVYHGKFAFFGNYAHPDGTTPWDPLWPPEDRWKTEKAWHKLFPEQFFFELGRTIAWGIQPMVCNIRENLFDDPEFASIHRFTLDTARFYHSNRKFLFDGEMLSPSGFTCATAPIDFMVRMIFTKERQSRTLHKTLPVILHSCWQAPDGEKALIMVNWTDKGQAWTLNGLSGTLPAHSYGKMTLPSGGLTASSPTGPIFKEKLSALSAGQARKQ